MNFLRPVIAAGADFVPGYGPYAPRRLNLKRVSLIAYSPGNFPAYKPFNTTGLKRYKYTIDPRNRNTYNKRRFHGRFPHPPQNEPQRFP